MVDSQREYPEGRSYRIQVRPEDTAELAAQIHGLLGKTPDPPSGPLALVKNLHTTITEYWIWITLVFFLMAWLFFDADPRYPIKKWAAASRELDAKLALYDYQAELSRRYIELGVSFLDDGRMADAQKAFKQALEMDKTSRTAQYGLMKSRLLSASAQNESAPEVIRRRIVLLEQSNPVKIGGAPGFDPHVAYARARLERLTGESAQQTRPQLARAVKIRPEFAAAHGELGLLAIREKDYARAVPHLERAHGLSPHTPFYMGALAHVHEEMGDISTALVWAKKNYTHDPELFTGFLEILRFYLVYQARFKWVAQKAGAMPERYEAGGLHKKRKNQAGYGIYKNGKVFFIRTWAAQKAYCAQLGLLAGYFHTLDQQKTGDAQAAAHEDLTRKLSGIWESAMEGENVLPVFLGNDLEKMGLSQKTTYPEFETQIRNLAAFALKHQTR